MATIRIACVVARTNKAGVTSWFWQPSKTLKDAGWEPIPLGKDEGAAYAAARARNAEVERWRQGEARPENIAPRAAGDTLSALIARYRREVLNGTDPEGNPILRASTQGIYNTGLARLDQWAGPEPLVAITEARVKALRKSVARPRVNGGLGRAAAFNLLRMGRQLFAFARAENLIAVNPFLDFDLKAPPSRRTIWEAEDEAAFIAAAHDLGLPQMALALELAIYTSQRVADLRAFTEAQYRPLFYADPLVHAHFADADGIVRGWNMAQGKTSDAWVSIDMQFPFEAPMRAAVEAAIRTNRARDRAANPARLLTYVLVDGAGLPWKKRAFIRCWRRIIEHAIARTGRMAMRELVWHDLRRTRVVRLRRIGMDVGRIAALTGHSPASVTMMLKVYGPIDPAMTAATLAAASRAA
jgi:site-specific recombinase XerD